MLNLNLDEIRVRNNYISNELIKPEILSNPNVCKVLAREQRELTQILNQYDMLQKVEKQINDDLAIIHKGKLLYNSTYENFHRQMESRTIEDEFIRIVTGKGGDA